MEHKIGEEFMFDGIKLEVRENAYGLCHGCFFYAKSDFCYKAQLITGSCSKNWRIDKKDVVFKIKEEKFMKRDEQIKSEA